MIKDYKNDLVLTIVIGSSLVLLIILLGASFFRGITETQIKSRKEFLRKQTELVATELEVEITRFEEDGINLMDYLDDGDLEEDDYDEDFTNATRRIFNDYPGLIDTVWVNLQDSVLAFTKTPRNDFIRTAYTGTVPSNTSRDFIYAIDGSKGNFEITFALDPVRYSKDLVSNYYLFTGGSKNLILKGELVSLNPEQNSQPIRMDEESSKQIFDDVSIGIFGLYDVEIFEGEDSKNSIVVQYPFDYGGIYRGASLLFTIESESITSGIYSTYLKLFVGFVVLLMGTVILFALSLRNNIESQKLLKESSREISELFDQQNILLKELRGFIFFHNFKGEITRVSDEVSDILGYSKEEFVSAFLGAANHNDVMNVRSQIREAIDANKTFVDISYDYLRPDGKQLRLRIFEKLIFDEEGRFNGGLGICTDITEQYQRQLELVRSGDRLRNLIDNLPDIILIYDNEATILDAHIKDERIIETLGEDLNGKSLYELIAESDREAFKTAFETARETGRLQSTDIKFYLKEDYMYFEVRFFPLDANQMMSISKDITRQRIWEKGLVEAMNAADLASRAKSEFLANMSHEIRTPINGLLGVIDLLEQSNLDEIQLHYVDIIKNSGDSLLSIIKDILDYSKIEAGKIEINSTQFNPAKELDKQVQIVHALARRKRISLHSIHGTGALELMEGDANKINQIILNLLGNAIKFTPDGGKVTVEIDVEEVEDQLCFLKCSVVDSGIGISTDEISKLTDPFYQLDSSSTRSYQGTGLGLAIAKKLVELMGGELMIKSKVGVGSEFSFTVLLKKVEDPQNLIVKTPIPPRKNWNGMASEYPLKILLAEDNELNLELMGLILDQLGYYYEIAKNGKEALDLIRHKDFDLVLMDVQMPVLNGLEATKMIRKLSGVKQLPIIGLSANVFDEDRRKALDSGMDDYLTKPIRLAVLAEKLKEFAIEHMIQKKK